MDTKTPTSNRAKADTVTSVPGASVFDLGMLFDGLWRWKWLVLLAAICGAAQGVYTIGNLVPKYHATMIVAPKSMQNSFSASSGGTGNLVGVAQSLGLVGAVSTTNISFDRYKVTIGSIQLAKVLQEKYQLLQKIHANNWDAVNKRWIRPVTPEDSFATRIRRFFHVFEWQEPDIESLANYVGQTVKIDALPKSPFFEISVVHSNREFARFLLTTVHNEADKLISQMDRQEEVGRKRYLEERLAMTQLSDVRQVLLSLLMNLEQQSMVTNADPPYVLRVIDPVHVPTRPDAPRFLEIVGTPIGVAIAIALALVSAFIAYQRE